MVVLWPFRLYALLSKDIVPKKEGNRVFFVFFLIIRYSYGRGGGVFAQTYYLAKIPPKRHENERNWTQRGRPWRLP